MKQNVTVFSPFRDGGRSYVEAYMNRLYALQSDLNYRYILVEGDSTDDTLEVLLEYAERDPAMTVLKCDTGLPRHGSVVNAERFEILAKVFNTGLDAVDTVWSDYAIFIPSDVLYEPDMISRLVSLDKDLVAPYFWVREDYGQGAYERFYDIWGFIDQSSSNFPLERAEWYAANYPSEPFRVNAVGGVILMKSIIIEAGCRYTSADVDHGLCWCASAKGFEVWADPTTKVYHPHP